jgi:hypothetical protein
MVKFFKKISDLNKKLDSAKKHYTENRGELLWDEKWKIMSDYTGIKDTDKAYKSLTSSTSRGAGSTMESGT